ncbi:hypothetical protein ACJX0J_041172, partial [Zea mays]
SQISSITFIIYIMQAALEFDISVCLAMLKIEYKTSLKAAQTIKIDKKAFAHADPSNLMKTCLLVVLPYLSTQLSVYV